MERAAEVAYLIVDGMVARSGFEVAFYLGSPQESGVLKGQGGARPMEIHFVSESVVDGTTLPAWTTFHT